MKKELFSVLLMALLPTVVRAYSIEIPPMYYSPVIHPLCHSIQADRAISGGTKILVDFHGEWAPDQKQAFLYACEMWEEVMPDTYPIRISATMDMTYKDIQANENSVLYEMSSTFFTKEQSSPDVWPSHHLQSHEKAFAYKNMVDSRISYNDYYPIDMSTLMTPDMAIVYYSYANMDELFSFSKNESDVGSKYDFVTMVLRNIAKGLGVIWTYNRERYGKIYVDSSDLTPFEECVYNILRLGSNANDSVNCFQNGTSNNFHFYGFNDGYYELYAPAQWDVEHSLNFFCADDSKQLTQLLRWDFGRGTVVRNIADQSVYGMFDDLLHWNDPRDIAVGGEDLPEPSTSTVGTNTSNSVPTSGTISIGSSYQQSSSDHSTAMLNMKNLQISTSPSDSAYNYAIKFHPCYMDGTIVNFGWIVSIQKKDGTWDVVYYDEDYGSSLNIGVQDFVFHENMDEYARTYDGKLKCRVTYSEEDLHTWPVVTYYYVIDAKPQTVDVDMNYSRTISYSEDDEYSKVIRVPLGNLEGVTKVMVAQKDAWATVPYSYIIPNFKKGYFETAVDVEYPTVFTIILSNSSGHTTRTVTYTPEYNSILANVTFSMQGNTINVSKNGVAVNNGQAYLTRYFPTVDTFTIPLAVSDGKIDIAN